MVITSCGELDLFANAGRSVCGRVYFLEECKMRICRILTNNALVVLDEKGKEQIVCGKGCCML